MGSPPNATERGANPSPAAQLLGGGLGLALLATCALLCVTRVIEHDVPWLLAAGDRILALHALPRLDPFSYTASGPWLNHEWGSEVLLALAKRAGGFSAIGALQAAIGLGLALLLFRASDRSGLGILAIALAMAGLRELLAPRAELFALPLVAAVYLLVLADLRRPGRALAWALPMQLLLTQLHGGDPLIVGLLALAAIAGGREGLAWRAGITVGAALLTCAGPYGAAVHEQLFGAGSALGIVREWQPLFRLTPSAAIACGLLLSLVGAVGLALSMRRDGPRPLLRFEAATLALFLLLALLHARFLRELLLVAAPPASLALARVRVSRTKGRALALATLLAVGFGASRATLGLGLDPARFPVAAVDFLRATRPPGPMFNSYNLGGYLLYALPGQPVFVDGRAFTVYPRPFLEALVATYAEPERFALLEERYGFRLAVVARTPVTGRLLTWLAARPTWRLVYLDDQVAILERSI